MFYCIVEQMRALSKDAWPRLRACYFSSEEYNRCVFHFRFWNIESPLHAVKKKTLTATLWFGAIYCTGWRHSIVIFLNLINVIGMLDFCLQLCIKLYIYRLYSDIFNVSFHLAFNPQHDFLLLLKWHVFSLHQCILPRSSFRYLRVVFFFFLHSKV